MFPMYDDECANLECHYHLICYSIEVYGNMRDCDGFKCSNHLFGAQEFSKEAGITYPIVVVQLEDK